MSENVNNPPKISIVTPSYNHAEFLEDAIRSVLDQNYPNLEYMIFDGGSDDDSVDVINKYENKIAHWISEKDNGQSDAINKGFKRATGDLIAWLNSDDFYYPDAFNFAAQAYMKHPDAGLYIGNGYITDKSGTIVRPYSQGVGFEWEALLKGQCYVLQPSVFINRKAMEKIGYLDEELNFEMDVDYWLRIGREFDVVVMNEFLSAYRWYDDIKTASGGIDRWMEQINIRQRFSDEKLTPGMIVELLMMLKDDKNISSLSPDLSGLIDQSYKIAFGNMQGKLKLKNNIPIGKGIQFKPDKTMKIEVTAVSENLPKKDLKVDLVLQATGSHAWAVGGGWENAATKLGVFNRIFNPQAEWGDEAVSNDDGLFEYLENPEADIMLLLGFDWHSQMLHSTYEWRKRFRNSPIYKIIYLQESIVHSSQLFENDLMKKAALSAASCADAIICTDINDVEFMKKSGKPLKWMPFGVDEMVFNQTMEFNDRIPRPFFRGKVTPFYTDQTYSRRRELIQFLLDSDLLDVIEYKEGPVTADEIAEDFNKYQISVNFPSLFSNHPTRLYEALACGCALLTNRTGITEVDELFEDGRHLLYYETKEKLKKGIVELINDPVKAKDIAEEGAKHVVEKFSLSSQLSEIMDWVQPHLKQKEHSELVKSPTISSKTPRRNILIDGVIFQLQQHNPAGISRVWKNLVERMGRSDLSDNIILLDRAGTAPDFPGIEKKQIHLYSADEHREEALYLEDICTQENADLFISTYYTYPENCRNILMLHDMTPEMRGLNLVENDWQAKSKAIDKANAYLSVSKSTMNDFRKLYPQFKDREVFVVPNAVEPAFKIHDDKEIDLFKQKYGISKPYFILSGHRLLYKNAMLFFRAFSLLENQPEYEIICTGGSQRLEKIYHSYIPETECKVLFLNDEELSTAYSGAIALVYPSQYEGFGLPVLEATQSGCPVITCPNSSLPEVAQDAAYYVNDTDVLGMRNALISIQKTQIRDEFIKRGLKNVERFSWDDSASKAVLAITQTLNSLSGTEKNLHDRIETGGRLVHKLSKMPENSSLCAIMTKHIQLSKTPGVHDSGFVQNLENEISVMNTKIAQVIQNELSNYKYCDAFMHFWLGLYLQVQGDSQSALNLYLTAMERPDFLGNLKWSAASRAAEIAYEANQTQLAQSLDTLVLNSASVDESVKRTVTTRLKESSQPKEQIPQPMKVTAQ